MSIRRALIVFAHPDPNSFTAALKNAAVAELETAGVQVDVSDLYELGFNPVAGPADVTERMSTVGFNLALEQGHALERDALAADIVCEQDKVRSADLIVFQFPMWWYGMPAIMKGWVDRVLSYKFAYGVGQWWDEGEAALASSSWSSAVRVCSRALGSRSNRAAWW